LMLSSGKLPGRNPPRISNTLKRDKNAHGEDCCFKGNRDIPCMCTRVYRIRDIEPSCRPSVPCHGPQ
jgi:hypothetical protein